MLALLHLLCILFKRRIFLQRVQFVEKSFWCYGYLRHWVTTLASTSSVDRNFSGLQRDFLDSSVQQNRF